MADEDSDVRLPSVDWETLAKAGWVAHCEVLGPNPGQLGHRLPQWSELGPVPQAAWIAAVKHALQTWLHGDFRRAIQDEELVDAAARNGMVGKHQGSPVSECLRHMIAFVPVALIDPAVFSDMSGEIFPPEPTS